MPVTNANPPTFILKPLKDGPLPTASQPDKPPQGVVTLFTGFTEGLVDTLVGKGGELASVYKDLADREGMVKWLKQVYDSVGQTVDRTTLIWEGPEVWTPTWPTDEASAYALSKDYESLLKSKGLTLDPSLKDGYHIKDAIHQRDVFFDKAAVEAQIAARGTDNYDIKKNIPWSFAPFEKDDATRMWLWANHNYPDGGFPEWYRIGGQLYHLEGKELAGYLVPADDYLSHPGPDTFKQLSLQLYGSSFVDETARLKQAGLTPVKYDAYQYSVSGVVGYTTANQILSRDSASFGDVPDGSIVVVGADYYLVRKGAGTKLDAAPTGVLTNIPSTIQPSSDARYRNAIASTLSLTMGGLSLVAGDYDMCLYAYGGGQVGHAKLPPVVVSTDPRNGGVTDQPPGTLLQYTDAQNQTSYYRVTGPGTVAAVEGPASIAKVVAGNPPDLSAIDAGTLVKLDDGKLYWVAKDKSTVPADGAPLLRFLSPERKANWDGIQVTEALLEAGLRLEAGDMDTCVYIDKNGDTVFAKLPAKVFDGPGDAPDGKNYAPGDVIESADGSHAWYIDAQGQAQEAKSRIMVKEVVSPDAFDPTKYDPGTVVGIEGGDYYRITADHQAVRISYPLEKLICNPSELQISSIQGKLKDLMNEKNTNMQGLMIRLQKLAGDQNWLATLIMGIVSLLANAGNSIARNMA